MAKQLLIDTNILKRLASRVEPSMLLKHLELLVRNDYVKLLVPESLKKEWEKHGADQKKVITADLKKMQKEARAKDWGIDQNNTFTDAQLQAKEKVLHQQINTINELITGFGVYIPLTGDVLLKVEGQKEKNAAPFHNKKSSDNDARIVFSVLDYMDNSRLNELYFVSNNESDFALSQEGMTLLHPEIQMLYPNIKVNYASHIKDVYLSLSQAGLPAFDDTIRISPSIVNNTIKIDRNSSILNQLYEYLEKRSNQLAFVPKRILLEHYPFITRPSSGLHHRPFTIITDNKNLYNLVLNVGVLNNEIVGDRETTYTEPEKSKLREILQYFKFGFLENIALNDGQSLDLFNKVQTGSCDCPVCIYQRFDFAGLFTRLNEAADSVTARMKRAYTLYKLGKFTNAARVLLDLKKDWQGDKNLSFYIINTNLVNLGFIIRQSYFPGPVDMKELNEEINNIDLNDIYDQCLHPSYQPLLDWLHEKKFFKDAFSRLHETLKQITDHFHGKNTGYNEYTNELIEYYFEMDRFLSANQVIYDVFGDYLSLTDLFTEGLFASYGCNKLMGGRLVYFSDSLVQKLLLHGRAETMLKYFRRYKLEAVQYRADNNDQTTKHRIKSLLASYKFLADDYEQDRDSYQEYMWDHYTELVFNAMALLGILDMPAADVNELALDICTLLESPHHLQTFHLSKNLQFFIIQNREKLSENLLERYFALGITNLHFIPDNYTENLKMVIEKRNFKISVAPAHFEQFRTIFLGNSEEQRALSWHTLGNVFSVIKEGREKDSIKEFVLSSLRDNFIGRNFYVAAMFNIIAPTEIYTELYTQEITNLVARGQQQHPFNNHPVYFDSRINDYLNFSFKYNLPLPHSLRTGLQGLGNYYKWLNDLENFNYELFDSTWINYYFTLYFKQYFRKSKALKAALLKSIRQKPDFDIEHRFLLAYCYED